MKTLKKGYFLGIWIPFRSRKSKTFSKKLKSLRLILETVRPVEIKHEAKHYCSNVENQRG